MQALAEGNLNGENVLGAPISRHAMTHPYASQQKTGSSFKQTVSIYIYMHIYIPRIRVSSKVADQHLVSIAGTSIFNS